MNGYKHMYQNIKVEEHTNVVVIQIYRPEANNSLNNTLISELTNTLIQYEENTEIKVVILEGLPNYFCTGMDFKALSDNSSEAFAGEDPAKYYAMLKLFSTYSKIIISKVEGKVNAGGIGLIAASDIVMADEKATFGLSEALFGLLPACVMPFLIRRIGYQKALWMSLTTQGISANKAYQIGLVDELSINIADAVRKSLLRLTRLETDTIKDLKNYASKLWIIDEQTQQLAVDKIQTLISSEKVKSNIKNFVKNGKFPWDK